MCRNLNARIDEFSSYQHGWLDGEGRSFQQADLNRVKQWLAEFLEAPDMPPPYIYPTPENGVQFEWSYFGWAVSFEFELDHNRIDLFATLLGAEEIRELQLPFSSESVAKAIEFFRDLKRGDQSSFFRKVV